MCTIMARERSRVEATSPAQLATKGWYPYGWLDLSKFINTASRSKRLNPDATKPLPN